MGRLKLLTFTTLAIVGCPSGDDPLDDPSGGGTPSDVATANCGLAPASLPTSPECIDFTDCGGSGNIVATPNCEICPRQAAFQVCEAGACRATDRTGVIRVAFEAPVTTVGARSIVTLAYLDAAGDGTQLTCAGLLSAGCDRLADEALPLVNANILEPVGGINDATPNFFTPIMTNVGENRVVVVLITTASNGAGEVRAVGCADGLTVTADMQTEVLMPMTIGPFVGP
ncbi:MAG: hypothetical protein AAFZ18_10675 [Myxococcota bacterium]